MQHLRDSHVHAAAPARPTPQIALASAFVLLAMGALILVAVPEPLRAVSAWIGQSAGSGVPGWVVPAFTGGFALGGVAIGVWVLSGFVQGVQSQPFAWLAPVLVALCALVASHAPAELPLWHVPAPLFAALCALVWLGGGALLRLPGWPAKVVGVLACASPVVFVVGSHAAAAGGLVGLWSQADASVQLFLYAVTTTAVGVVLLAAVTGSEEGASRGAGRRGHFEAELQTAVDRARVSEERLSEAQQELSRLAERVRASHSQPPAMLAGLRPAGEDTQELATMMKPRVGAWMRWTVGTLVFGALGTGGYFGVHRPLVMRAQAQVAAAAARADEQELALTKLRAEIEAARAEQAAALAAEQTSAREALAAAEAAKAELAALQVAQTAAAAAPEVAPAPTKVEQRQVARRRAKTVAARREARAERAERIAAAKADRQERRATAAFSGKVDDDPIGGLGL